MHSLTVLMHTNMHAYIYYFLDVLFRTHHIPSRTVMAVKVIQLDATPDEQRKIMSELDILHKVLTNASHDFYFCLTPV